MNTKNKRLLAIGALVLSCKVASSVAGRKEAAQAQPITRVSADTLEASPEALKGIATATASRTSIADRLSVMGRVSPTEDRVTVVPARVAGRISGVLVASGEGVTEGQELAMLFSPDFAASREEYLQALKQGAGAKDFADLARKKLEIMGLSPSDIDGLAQLQGERANLMPVRAPTTGVLLEKKAVVGNIVNVGDTMFTIGDLRKVWFVGDIYPEDLRKVHKNQDVVIVPVGIDTGVRGKVSFISPVIDPTSRTVKIRAIMDNPEALLRSDMYVQGGILLSQRAALAIPLSAVIHLGNDQYCFKKIGPAHFKKVAVRLGVQRDALVEVLGGLSPGDVVVLEGALLLDAALSQGL